MRFRDPTAWMWQEACDLLDEAEQLHRRFFRLGSPGASGPIWEPPVNVFEDEHSVTIVAALPGVSEKDVKVTMEGDLLAIRAESTVPCGGPECEILRLEIPYGYFERRIQLPAERLEPSLREFRDGCLVLNLRKL